MSLRPELLQRGFCGIDLPSCTSWSLGVKEDNFAILGIPSSHITQGARVDMI